MRTFERLRSVLVAEEPLTAGQAIGFASALTSFWIMLDIWMEGPWVAGAVIPMGAMVFTLGLAVKQRAYAPMAICAVCLMGIALWLGAVGPQRISPVLLVVVTGFFDVVLFLVGYTWPAIQRTGATSD